ncbi:MAG: GNAT family N-acetyltransferase [Bacteroidetes bacterium]|nr:GNAT family N-acetyltransferase [Bacteroidota bacterium]
MLEKVRIKLVLFTEEHFQAIFADDMPRLGKALDVNTPETWTEYKDAMDALPVFYKWFHELGPENPWGSYFIVHRMDKELIGTGGYKGNPTEDAIVEIGYEIRKSYRNLGLATETVSILVNMAFSNPGIRAVCAHTLAADNASASVLKKNGFTAVGTVTDPQDGEVCRWILNRQ